MKTVTRLLLVVSLAATTHSAVLAQHEWVKDANNPVMSGGAAGSWDHHVYATVVLYNADSTRYEMWFGGVEAISPWEPQVGFATSPDGVTWTRHPEPVLEGDPNAWDPWVAPTAVVREGGSYKMWYVAGGAVGIGYATSPDGMTWTKYSGNPVLTPGPAAWEADHVFWLSVLPVDGGGYEMWYTGIQGPTWSVGYAVSDDGILWNKADSDNPVLTGGPAGSWDHYSLAPEVQRLPHPDLGLVYHMWYSASVDEFFPYYGGWATSMDGIHWTKHDTLVLGPGPALWDQDVANPGSVLIRENTLHMWYGGGRDPIDTHRWRIGHATSVCPNGHCTIVGREDMTIPEDYVLDQNYPNPFNPATTISYTVSRSADVTLLVYDLLGRQVRELATGTKPPGTYEVTFDATGLPSGVYFYRLQAGDHVETKRMVVVR